MKDIVSANTAQILKNEGFPQPVPQERQVWYYNGQMRVILKNDSDDMFIWNGATIDWFGIEKSKAYCYAPTATELLEMVGGTLSAPDDGTWMHTDTDHSAFSKSLPELLSLVWRKKNRN